MRRLLALVVATVGLTGCAATLPYHAILAQPTPDGQPALTLSQDYQSLTLVPAVGAQHLSLALLDPSELVWLVRWEGAESGGAGYLLRVTARAPDAGGGYQVEHTEPRAQSWPDADDWPWEDKGVLRGPRAVLELLPDGGWK